MILVEATLRFVLKVFSVLRRWRARYSVPSGCLGRTVVQNLTPDVALFINKPCLFSIDGRIIHFSRSSVTRNIFMAIGLWQPMAIGNMVL